MFQKKRKNEITFRLVFWMKSSVDQDFILSKQSFSGIPFEECLYGWTTVNGVKLNNEWERDSLK